MSGRYGLQLKAIGVILIAIIIKLLLDYQYAPVDRLPLFAQSAISRAKSKECKQQIREVASSIKRHRLRLTRTCPLDLMGPNSFKIGCCKDPWKGAILVNELTQGEQACLNICFSYGHSFAGYVPLTKECYCNNKPRTIDKNDCHDDTQINIFRVDHGIFKSNLNASYMGHSPTNSPGPIKIAFVLILSGRSSQQILRIVNAIYSERHIYYLHIDEKDEFLLEDLSRVFAKMGRNNILFARHRYATIWGGPKLLDMMLETIRQLNTIHGWDYLINLSETDFPIKPIGDLEEYIGHYASLSPLFLKFHSLKGYNFILKQGLNMHFVQCDRRAWLVGQKRLPLGIVYSGGSDWMALPRDFCKYIVDSLEGSIDSSLTNALVETYKTALLPAESFFHTLAMNSHFCNRIVRTNLRFANWRGRKGCNCQQQKFVDWCGCGPMIYRSRDAETLNSSKSLKHLFFSRKFDSRFSMSILNFIENNLLSNQSNSGNDTRYWQNIYTREYDPRNEVLEEFALLSYGQVSNLEKHDESIPLDSIYAFYNQDQFVGWVNVYCSGEICSQILITKSWNRTYTNKICNKYVKLKSYELGYNYDEREQVFRGDWPLNSNSTVALLLEWIFIRPNSKIAVEIVSKNEVFNITSSQAVTVEHPSRSNRSIQLHLLGDKLPIEVGVWTLKISIDTEECLRTSFLVLGSATIDRGEAKRNMMNAFDYYYPLEGHQTIVRNSRSSNIPTWLVK